VRTSLPGGGKKSTLAFILNASVRGGGKSTSPLGVKGDETCASRGENGTCGVIKKGGVSGLHHAILGLGESKLHLGEPTPKTPRKRLRGKTNRGS